MRNRGEERHTTKSAGKRERTRYPLFPMRLNEFKYRARLITFGNKLTFSLFSPANKDKCESRTRQVREASQTRREERVPFFFSIPLLALASALLKKSQKRRLFYRILTNCRRVREWFVPHRGCSNAFVISLLFGSKPLQV